MIKNCYAVQVSLFPIVVAFAQCSQASTINPATTLVDEVENINNEGVTANRVTDVRKRTLQQMSTLKDRETVIQRMHEDAEENRDNHVISSAVKHISTRFFRGNSKVNLQERIFEKH
uniref:RxLR effector protein n=1 Tax=Spongospora subterranea TaxID=70186 RepID=A0A0H5R8I6_9EUKA|eukprot:CRZ10032.1 hypothetical protein [Spongospora subterranea]